MCRLSCITGPLTLTLARRFTSRSAELFAPTQRDGFGTLFIGPDSVRAERTLDPRMYGASRRIPAAWRSEQNSDGTMPTTLRAVVCHGRQSTNYVCLENVHPFRTTAADGRTLWLAHNGILQWCGGNPAPVAPHGCDSEEFAVWLAAGGTWEAAPAAWSGYGALFTVGPDDNHLRLIKCSRSTLYCVPRRRGWIFATDRRDCERLARLSDVTRPSPVAVPATQVAFADTGEMATVAGFPGFTAACPTPVAVPARKWKPANGRRFYATVQDKELFPDWTGPTLARGWED